MDPNDLLIRFITVLPEKMCNLTEEEFKKTGLKRLLTG